MPKVTLQSSGNRLNLHLRPDLLAALHELAAAEGVPLGVLVESLLAEGMCWRLIRRLRR
jgi:hypothetical protein